MNGGRSDASTSTDDVKGRPLCLFYFTHPFGVLSPEPPTALGAAPAHIARAFLNMEPVSPFYWPAGGTDTGDSYRSTATGDTFDLGAATVHAHPVSVVSVRRARAAPLPRARRDSLSSSLFSSDLWFESSCSSRAADAPPPRRLLPYNCILPPLRLPSARTLSECSSEDVWPRKCLHPEKFSLPPIELPAALPGSRALAQAAAAAAPAGAGRELRARRRLGVDKLRRRRRAAAADVRRVLACLIRRAVTGGRRECSPSPVLLRVLATIRDAWAEPTTLRERCGTLNRTFKRWMMEGPPPARQPHAPLEPPPQPHASPGLLRRRYSVPETIMRKYRLAQQHSDSEESVAAAARWSAASACPSPAREASHSPCDSPHRFLRRDRELMRKSALLRRMWARPCPANGCRCCEEARATRSLDGSRSELSSRRSPAPRAAPWAEPKRQRLEPPTAASGNGDLSDSTFRSHRAGRELCSCADTTDAFTDTESRLAASPPSSQRLSAHATAELERSPPDSDTRDDRSYPDSETFSATVSTAKETSDSPPRDSLSSNGRIEGRVSERSAGVDNEDHNVPSYERSLGLVAPVPAPLYELLEVVVSESADTEADIREGNAPSSGSALTLKNARDIDIDQYVSNILVESLNSLTDQLESMNASIGAHRRISIVEKEIKVRLQNTGVNTIVHLSPTSNNQIIFGNEELCNEPRDQCNNLLSIREERDPGLESNDNLTSSAGSGAPPPPPPPRALALDPPLQRDTVNRAVLQQIQKLFRDELRGLEEEDSAPPGVSHVEISNVDAYMEAQGAARPELQISTHVDGDVIAGVGAGNYFQDGGEAATVPRFSAFPHTDSMEVNTSSSSEGEAACSECTSLVDSLDDPNSPRAVPARRRAELARSAVDVLELLPERARDASADSRSEAFFVRIEDDDFDCRDPDRLEGSVRVAEYMPEKIKQRLFRRHRKRELRMECARRSKVKQLKKELERRRLEEAAVARRDLERDCMVIVNALIDDVVAKIAQDEYKCMRIKRRNGKLRAASSEENLTRRTRRRDFDKLDDRHDSGNVKRGSSRHSSNKENRNAERHIHGKLLARPSLMHPDRPPRRIYQKSEIHEGEKCIEILEILEYVNGSQSSPETTNSDENHNHNSRCKKSRIPIPVYERLQRTSDGEGRMRLTGGDGRRPSPPPTGHMLASMLLQALGDSQASPASAPAPPEPRSRSNSLRFKRVFDMIPEERSSLSFESSAEDAELVRRASAPEVSVPAPTAPPPPPRSAATSPPRGASTRSAGTSPPAERVRALRSQTTMTSPCSKSAATSPLRPAAPPAPPARPAPPRPAREGRAREKTGEVEEESARAPTGERSSATSVPAPLAGEHAGAAAGARRWLPERRAPPAEQGAGARGRRRGATAGEGERAARPPAGGSSSSDSGDSGGSLLCSLAPRWLSSHARQRRRARRPPPPLAAPRAAPPPAAGVEARGRPSALADRGPGGEAGSGGWSVTVAGSCRAALPADVEMRLRFPPEPGNSAPPPHRTAHNERCAAAPHALSAATYQECTCVQCARCAGARAALPPAPASPAADPRLTLTMKKEAQDSSILASKSVRKSSEQLPELETYRSSRTKTKSSVKMRRGYSLHCWLPDDEPAPIRANNGLSVLGCAIIPELKPRVPTMSERDLTRVYTPRHYLRS